MKPSWRTWREDVGGLAGVGVLGALAWLLVVRPGSDAQAAAESLRMQTDLVRSEAAMIEVQLKNTRSELDTAGAGVGLTSLQPASQFNRVLALLNEAAVEAGIALDQVLPGTVERSAEMTRYRIGVSGRGTYPGAVAFLGMLRDRFPDVTVVALSASRMTGETDSQAVLSFELAWHAQPDGGVSPSPQ